MKIAASGPRELKIADKKIFEEYLSLTSFPTGAYSFSNIFVWKKLFNIFWYKIDGALCVFFKGAGSCFMYVEPLKKKVTKKILNKCFAIMDENNTNKSFSRIENIHLKKRKQYEKLGFIFKGQFPEYVYLRKDIAELKGNKYKSQRAEYNYFKKHYNFKYIPFSLKDTKSCLNLLGKWSKQLKNRNTDSYFHSLLDDSCRVQNFAFEYFRQLGIIGRIIKIRGRVAGYTFGYTLNNQVLCVFFEVCDYKFKGISKYIFSEFCREFSKFKYVNVLDDSGIESIRKTKLQFKPAFIAKTGSIFKKQS